METAKQAAEKSSLQMAAEAIARVADAGEDVSPFFTNKGRRMEPIQRVNLDLTKPMLAGLDLAAKALNINRQAVIKTLIRQALDQHYLATAQRAAVREGEVGEEVQPPILEIMK